MAAGITVSAKKKRRRSALELKYGAGGADSDVNEEDEEDGGDDGFASSGGYVEGDPLDEELRYLEDQLGLSGADKKKLNSTRTERIKFTVK